MQAYKLFEGGFSAAQNSKKGEILVGLPKTNFLVFTKVPIPIRVTSTRRAAARSHL